MTDWRTLATSLTTVLELADEPIAVTRAEPGNAVSAGVESFDAPMSEPTPDGRSGRVPASCVFWMEAAEKTFSTEPADHGNCSVGKWVHGFASLDEIAEAADVGTLFEAGWVTSEDVAAVQVMDDTPEGLVYGPLAEATLDPDVVVLRLTPQQMMVLGDAIPDLALSTKPQCQIIPKAFAGGATVSMGCALSRERTGMPDEQLTFAVAAGQVPDIIERLASVAQADTAVRNYAEADLQRFPDKG